MASDAKLQTVMDQALLVIRDNPITNVRTFGLLLWGDTNKWRPATAGSYLGKLRRAGLITGSNTEQYKLTVKGEIRLNKALKRKSTSKRK